MQELKEKNQKKKQRDKLPTLKRSVGESPELREAIAQIRLREAHSALIFNSAIEEGKDK